MTQARTRRLIGALKSGTMALALLSAAPALAQEVEEDGSVRLGTIFLDVFGGADDDANSVVATELGVGGKVATSVLDTPASVSIITEKEIRLRKADTTEKVLQYSAGIHSDYYGTDDRNDYFMIRGFQATTYRDGLTLGSMRGVREEPLAYERVEVLRGANSALFGVADPGGSVNFVTRKPKFERIAETSLSYGSFDTKAVTFDYNDAASDRVAFRITGKVQDGALEYDHSENDETFLMAGVTWKASDATELSLVLDYLNRSGTPNSGGYPLDREYDRSDFFGEPEFNYHDVERTSLSAILTHDFGGGLSLRGNLRYSELTDDFGYVFLSDSATRVGSTVPRFYFGTDSSAEEVIGNVILQYDTLLGNVASSTLGGIEFRDATTESSSFYALHTPIDLSNPVFSGPPTATPYYTSNRMDYATQSLFVTQNFSFNEKFILTFGLRRDFLDLKQTNLFTSVATEDSFAETSGRIALTYKVTDEISVYGSFVESVAPPVIGTEPERGEQYEIGAKWAPAGMNALFSASVYDLTKNNVTIAVVDPDSGVISQQTIGESRVRGLDLEAKVELSEQLSVIGAYSYMDTEFVKGVLYGTVVDGNAFVAAPNHTASVWVNYTLPSAVPTGDVTLGMGLRYVGSYYFDAANTRKSQDALLVDASVGVDLGETAALELSVSNLLDEQHVVGSGTSDYYNPGREIGVTLRKTW